ncbi:zf-HC2 domain-containing protein [Paenibacillus sp. YPG26]|uniref:zf-HC2 domain-containing protein n=1 Tax=Paenibacillus sp. YPG26 TaxID=2878915 RepID=UPI00203F6CF5|nr:zf-HC2 domain-containing protein [Paenibacillus sp. YPG26]USB32711.1 zf-HC2 domain-containing protein [Paenibacillus sp. YPG26]
MDCKQAASLMHDYLDEDLERAQALELKKHLVQCPSCNMHFQELEQTEMMLFHAVKSSVPSASDELVERIMREIPGKRRQRVWMKWIKRHPALTAVAMFLFVMLFSTMSLWKADDQLIVKGAGLDQVVIEGRTVIVPNGKTIAGDLTVENGKAQIYGEVDGNLTVIDGSLYQASTAKISGDVKSIDQALDWIWYKITNTFTEVAYR